MVTDTTTTALVRAAGPEIIELDVFSEKALSHFTVTFALLYPVVASDDALRKALASILPTYRHLGGRLVRKADGGLAILCNDGGVPLTHRRVPSGEAPSLATPIAVEHFDMVEDHMPGDEEGDIGGPLMRLKVTDFEDGQLVAVCLNHLLCDARGMGDFLSAWSASFRGCFSGHTTPSLGRKAVYPPTVEAYGGAPLSRPATEVPAEWLELRHPPEACPEPRWAPMVDPVFASIHKTADACRELKDRCVTAAATDAGSEEACTFVSTNDAACAELAAALAHEGQQKVPITMVVEFRELIAGGASVVGNLWTMLEFLPRASLAGAADIRRTLPHISKDFIDWHLGQAMVGMNTSWPGQLMMNSWVKAFDLSELHFAAAPIDIMVGTPMMQQRAQGMVPRGISYCIALPRSDGGVKLATLMPAAAADKIVANGNNNEVTSIAVNAK